MSMANRLRAGLDAAIATLNDEKGRGGKVKLAKKLRVYPSAISQWDRVPIERVAAVERITGIDRSILRPDFYAEPSRRAA